MSYKMEKVRWNTREKVMLYKTEKVNWNSREKVRERKRLSGIQEGRLGEIQGRIQGRIQGKIKMKL